MPSTDPTSTGPTPTGPTVPAGTLDPAGTSRWASNAGSSGRRSRLMRAWPRRRDETGAATAEYAVATMAAVGFAGLLIVI
ncbi:MULTISPECIES: DUF4244 domain-containing protein [unclassified Cryobacterium]|uniref:DUF4244 domain-containing protein n=1 Tax=unclassified Cryobacterium TaxID=2649013 RepID=UPI001F5447A2